MPHAVDLLQAQPLLRTQLQHVVVGHRLARQQVPFVVHHDLAVYLWICGLTQPVFLRWELLADAAAQGRNLRVLQDRLRIEDDSEGREESGACLIRDFHMVDVNENFVQLGLHY